MGVVRSGRDGVVTNGRSTKGLVFTGTKHGSRLLLLLLETRGSRRTRHTQVQNSRRVYVPRPGAFQIKIVKGRASGVQTLSSPTGRARPEDNTSRALRSYGVGTSYTESQDRVTTPPVVETVVHDDDWSGEFWCLWVPLTTLSVRRSREGQFC